MTVFAPNAIQLKQSVVTRTESYFLFANTVDSPHTNMKAKLTKQEKTESLFTTLGRIQAICGLGELNNTRKIMNKDKERLILLMEKLSKDIDNATIIEKNDMPEPVSDDVINAKTMWRNS